VFAGFHARIVIQTNLSFTGIFSRKISLTAKPCRNPAMDKLPRPTTEDERAEIKAATRHSLSIVSGKRFSLVTRVQAPALSNYGSISEPKDFMPVDVLADLQKEFGRGIASPLLEALASIAGFKLVPLDDGDDDDVLGFEDVGTMLKEGGEASASALKVASSPTNLAAIRDARKEIGESIAVKAAAARKLAQQERRLLRRAG
jgi:hypothetical protein